MIALSPEVIHQELPHYCRAWPTQRILFISRSVIETSGSVLHPHHRAVARNFPELLNHLDMPLCYPHPSAVERMDNVIEARESGVYLNRFVFELEKKQKEIAHRGEVANQLRRESQMKVRKGDTLPFAFSKYSEVAGATQCTQVQMDSPQTPVHEVQTQTKSMYSHQISSSSYRKRVYQVPHPGYHLQFPPPDINC